MKVMLDNPVTVVENGEEVVYDHLWLQWMIAPNINPNKPAEVRMRLRKARDLPKGRKKLYMGESPIDIEIPDLFALLGRHPEWGMILLSIIEAGKALAKEQGAIL